MSEEKIKSLMGSDRSFIHDLPREITKEEREINAYRDLRQLRAVARYYGKRKARAAKVNCILLLI